jgi:uncharacterized phage protein (TIGR02218 family)
MFESKTHTAGQGLPIATAYWEPETGVEIQDDHRETTASAYASATTFSQYFGGFWRKSKATGREITVAEFNAMQFGWRQPDATHGLLYVAQAYLEALCYVSPPSAQAAPSGNQGFLSLLQHGTHRLARLWTVEPVWGAPLLLTDHNAPLSTTDGATYVPSGGFSVSDKRAQLGLADADVEITGVISSSAITVADLQADRYTGARIVERIVDWRYPWAGAFVTNVWTIFPTEFDGEVWKAQALGLTSRLQERGGDAYYPRCRFHLFDDDLPIPGTVPTWERGCKLDAMGYFRTLDVTGTITDRRTFVVTVNGSPSLPAGWFDGGVLVWVKGANAGVVREIRNVSGTTVNLQIPLPFDVASSDGGMLWPGCNYLKGRPNAGDCFDKYANVQNWGGFELIPGTDAASRGASI